MLRMVPELLGHLLLYSSLALALNHTFFVSGCYEPVYSAQRWAEWEPML
jgi:hypothetical protein